MDTYNTAVAAALTVFAETQAAIPTNTPSPSPTVTLTPTPNATTTLPPLPTLGATFVPNPTATAPVDPCIDKLLPDVLNGTKIKIRVNNPTQSAINVSVYLQQTATQNICGYRGYVLAAQDSLIINDLIEGCYSLWAWNPDPDKYFMVTNGTSCLNSSQSWTFEVLPGSIRLKE